MTKFKYLTVTFLLSYSAFQPLKTQIKYLKTGVLKSIVDAIKHANFQLCRVHPAGFIWKNRLFTTNLCTHTSSTFNTSNCMGLLNNMLSGKQC